MSDVNRLEAFAKYAAIVSAIVAASVGIAQYRRAVPAEVAPALEAALQTNGPKRTESQRFIGDRYDRFFFLVSQLQSATTRQPRHS